MTKAPTLSAGQRLSWLDRMTMVGGIAIGWAALALVVLGGFRKFGNPQFPQLMALLGLVLLISARAWRRHHLALPTAPRLALLAEVELVTLLASTALVVTETWGGPQGILYPINYVVVIGWSLFGSRVSIVYLLILLGVVEASLITFNSTERYDWYLFASHAAFGLVFTALALTLRRKIAKPSSTLGVGGDTLVDAQAASGKSKAPLARLSFETFLSRGDWLSLNVEELQRRRLLGSVQSIHESLTSVLSLAERVLHPFTVALLWLEPDGQTFRVKEVLSRSAHITKRPLRVGEGLLGLVAKRHEPLTLNTITALHPGLVYYSRPEAISAFAAVPVLDNGTLRGILLADRTDAEPFRSEDIQIMQSIAQEALRSVQIEHVLAEMGREQALSERFYESSRDFSSALTLEQASQVAIDAAVRLADVEFASLVVCSDDSPRLRIASVYHAASPEDTSLVDQEFALDEGIVGAAIKARQILPQGAARVPMKSLFAPHVPASFDNIRVFPLIWKDRAVGALVLGSGREDFLTAERFEMMRVIADQAAVAIANARMFERMEHLATTDGLTGLVNHRAFQSLFDAALVRAERYQRKLSLLFADIDHFKQINDTHGHPVGDVVLSRIAAIIKANARKCDVVARYGGEEFAVLMEETDQRGAVHTAERIRRAVAAETFRFHGGQLQCTLSVGIATSPDSGLDKKLLTEYADQALYEAKRQGRNRVIIHGTPRAEMHAQSPLRSNHHEHT